MCKCKNAMGTGCGDPARIIWYQLSNHDVVQTHSDTVVPQPPEDMRGSAAFHPPRPPAV